MGRRPGAKNRYTNTTDTIENIVSGAYSELEQLGSEMREWYDNMPENLQAGQKASDIEAAADALESLNQPDVPEALKNLTVDVVVDSKAGSRPARRDDVISQLRTVVDFLEDIEEGASLYQAAQDLKAEVEELADEAEAVEFPGMYG